MARYKFLTAIALLFIAVSCSRKTPDLILTCGWDEVSINDISKEVPEKIWTWKAEGSLDLPKKMYNKFLTTDECKSLDQGKRILVTSSSGGVALIEQATGRSLFYASVPNAHSAELIPKDLIAVAASFSSAGNRILLYNIKKSDLIVFSDSLYGAHGVQWDKKRKILWAIGTHELRSYSLLEGDTPGLELIKSMPLPDDDGHDLVFLDSKDVLCLTTGNNVWLYDIEENKFSEHPLIGGQSKVKSVSYNRLNKQTAYMKATDENWWGFYIRYAGSNKVVHLPGEKIYKARWVY